MYLEILKHNASFVDWHCYMRCMQYGMSGLNQDQVDVCKHVVYYCVHMKEDIERMTQAQHAAK